MMRRDAEATDGHGIRSGKVSPPPTNLLLSWIKLYEISVFDVRSEQTSRQGEGCYEGD